MAPQAAPHRRGGTHRVKDQDKTNTIFDDYDYKMLKSECIARGVYVKDMKKVEMARTLARNEQEKKEAEREAIRERAREQQRLEREKQEENDRRLKADAAKHRRRMEREAKRANDEDVSDTTPDEDEIQAMYEMYEDNSENADQGPVGRALSEESWDSTSTESSFRSENHVDIPACKLRLFEWSYKEMPSPTKRSAFAQDSDETPAQRSVGVRVWIGDDEVDHMTGARVHSPTAEGQRALPVPRNVPYAPLKVHTTLTSEKLFLPGQTYPPGVDPDYVPILSERTRHAARNGVLEGVLRKATIGSAASWTDRTQVQGWNARMFFHLPPCNEEKHLPDVYEKWYLENRKLLRVKPLGDGSALTRKQRHDQRHRNKGKKQAEVLDASEYRVPAMCYLPAYLDYSVNTGIMEAAFEQEEHTLDNLFYIRFPGCDVPHYYFWTREGEWADPTTPNPSWTPELAERDIKQRIQPTPRSRLSGKSLPKALPPRQLLVRVKKSIDLPPPPSSSTSPTVATLTSQIEHDIYTHGLSSTLATYRAKWLDRGNEHAWRAFSLSLPFIYPSGELPSAPPVYSAGNMSVAEQIARIDLFRESTFVFSLSCDQPWTRYDNEWWEVVELSDEDDVVDMPDYAPLNPSDLEPLYRRASVQSPLIRRACEKWLEAVSPADVPLTPECMPDSPARVREEWEERFLAAQRKKEGLNVVCPFCLDELKGLSMKDQAAHMYAHSAKEQVEFPRVALPSPQWMHTKRSEIIDTGAEADGERTPRIKPTHTKRKRSDHSHPNLDSLHFLDAYGSRKPWSSMSVEVGDAMKAKDALDRRTSKTNHPMKRKRIVDPTYHDADEHATLKGTKRKAAPIKRRKIADPTYRVTCEGSEDDEKYVPTRVLESKKRKRIDDPTFRITSRQISSSEDDEDVRKAAPQRKKSKKSKRVNEFDVEVLPIEAVVASQEQVPPRDVVVENEFVLTQGGEMQVLEEEVWSEKEATIKDKAWCVIL